ncbi:hypothetical protein ACIRSS_05340 [Amycolatopsis sp. NPDC101161]|uniref:hypothetical protein n=1 Tax=Amycolatopsis sp. NPDC101161 TaxID=3363940 RepID=UPI0037F45906
MLVDTQYLPEHVEQYDPASSGVAQVLAGSGLDDTGDHSLLLALWFSTVSTTISWWSEHASEPTSR